MFDMGFLELALIAGIALIVLGPERLPVAARTVGRYIGQVRRFVGEFQRQIEQETRLEELNRKIMEDTKGQQFTNNDGTPSIQPEGDETHAEALARARANREAEANRLRTAREAEETAAAERLKAVEAERQSAEPPRTDADRDAAVDTNATGKDASEKRSDTP